MKEDRKEKKPLCKGAAHVIANMLSRKFILAWQVLLFKKNQ